MSHLGGVILAGGLGRRMHPLTLDWPKPLLPVGASTLVEHQIAALTDAGVDRIVLATGYRHTDFAEVVARSGAQGHDVTTVIEESPAGTGGGLRRALLALPDADAVVVLNGDLLTGHDLATQAERLQAAPQAVLAAVHVRDVDDPKRYGSVLTDDRGRITAFVEKSPNPPSSTVNAGTYVVRPSLAEVIPASATCSLEHDVFPVLAQGGALIAHREDAYFLDVGTPQALIRANRDLVLGRWLGSDTEAGRSGWVHDRPEAFVLPGARVHATARLGGGTVIHPGAVVGADAVLKSALVLADARIGPGAQIVRSVVGRRAQVGRAAHLVDCALGSDVTVPDGERAEALVLPQRD